MGISFPLHHIPEYQFEFPFPFPLPIGAHIHSHSNIQIEFPFFPVEITASRNLNGSPGQIHSEP